MQPMTSKERFLNAVNRKPVDRLPVHEAFWKDTLDKWRAEGHLGEQESPHDHFEIDLRTAGWLSSTADLDYVPETIEETEDTILQKDGNGAILRRHKKHSATPEHVDFSVKDREAWEEKIKPFLLGLDRRRIPFEGYREGRRMSVERDLCFGWAGVAPFEQMHPVCGHEYMLMGMALDPDWVRDMVMTYANMTINHLETLFSEEGAPDLLWFYEDMGFKGKPFMSPDMYREIVQPGHKKLFDFAHSLGLRVLVHSCGYVEPLVPGLVEAGMDCLQAMEVKAGMDMRKIKDKFGDRISFFGNIDVREIISNDRARIAAELNAKIPPMMKAGCGYILHSDHSIPPDVEHETMHYFVETGREMNKVKA